MDELAVAAATLAVSMDVDDEEELGVEVISGTVGAAAVLHSILATKGADKENEAGLPVGGDQRAEGCKVIIHP